MTPRLTEGQRYRVTLRSNERRNARRRQFVGDYLGTGGIEGRELLFSLRPAAGTSSVDTRWHEIIAAEPVPKSTPNHPPATLAAGAGPGADGPPALYRAFGVKR